jgi:hypothetical protein
MMAWLLSVTLAFLQGAAGAKPAGCDPAGNVQFICGVIGPEDLVSVPGGEWVIASGDAAGGAITLINVRDKTTTALFPTASPNVRRDAKTYDSCPGPLMEDRDKFRAHGIALRPGKNSVHTLYVVHHGDRESIEVFEFDGAAKPPALTWIGCALPPDPVGLNSVVALPEGGFASTNFQPRGPAGPGRANMLAGEKNGELWEWHTGTGWKKVPGSEASGANGIEISKDGKWFYMGGWGNQTFIRMSRGQTPAKRDEIPVGFRLDNLRWAPDGSLIAAGQETGPTPPFNMAVSHVVKIDPKTLKVREVIRYPFNEAFNFATGAIQVGNEMWVGSVRGDRIARFPLPK